MATIKGFVSRKRVGLPGFTNNTTTRTKQLISGIAITGLVLLCSDVVNDEDKRELNSVRRELRIDG